METTVTLEYGPLKAEIFARDDENYQDEILDFLKFLENNQERFESLGTAEPSPDVYQSKTERASLEDFASESEEAIEASDEIDNPFKQIASSLRISPERLEDFLYVDPEREDSPVLFVDKLGELGERQTDRQRVASLALLYTWHEYYDEERVKSTDLKNALELSDISSSGMANMYQGDGDRLFDRRGRGPTATVRLTAPGLRQARNVLKQMAEDIESSD